MMEGLVVFTANIDSVFLPKGENSSDGRPRYGKRESTKGRWNDLWGRVEFAGAICLMLFCTGGDESVLFQEKMQTTRAATMWWYCCLRPQFMAIET
jgi:hypothetical protein